MKKQSSYLTKEAILTAELTEGEKVMWRFREAVKNETMLSIDDLRFLDAAFGKILDGEAPKKALKIEKPQGRRRTGIDADKELQIVIKALEHVLPGKKPSRAPLKVVANNHNISTKTLGRYLREHGDTARSILEWANRIPKLRKQYAELVKTFGEKIGKCPAVFCDQLANAMEQATPIEYNDICSRIKTFLEQK